MKGLKLFRNKVTDVRLRRIHFGDRIQVEPVRDFSITFWPSFYMWFHKTQGGNKVDSDHVCMCGLVFRFMYWSVDVFDYTYKRPYIEPWIEDRDRNYISSLAEYQRHMKH